MEPQKTTDIGGRYLTEVLQDLNHLTLIVFVPVAMKNIDAEIPGKTRG